MNLASFEHRRAIPHLPPTLRFGAAGSPLPLRKGEAIMSAQSNARRLRGAPRGNR